MGIRFHCPHCGRALNVKTAQAGLVGVCPFCRGNVKVTADPLMDPDHSSLSEMIQTGILEVDNQITQVGLNPAVGREFENEYSVPEASPNRPARRFKMPEPQEEAKESFSLDRPVTSVLAENVDPIAEAPQLVWYYRSPDSNEKGPLKSKFLLEELEAGRIKPGFIVWREDWDDWLPAEKAFPRLVSSSALLQNGGVVDIPDELNPESAMRLKIKQRQYLTIVFLLFAMIVIGALVYSLNFLIQ